MQSEAKKMNQVIIYGAKETGKRYLDFLEWRGLKDRVLGFCDKNYQEIQTVGGLSVFSYEAAKQINVPFLIAVSEKSAVAEVLHMFKEDGLEGYLFTDLYRLLEEEHSVFLREWCAYHHAKNNDVWYKEAEKKESVKVFWEDSTPFYQYFKELDLRNVIELACGRGRHVPYYLNLAGQITLVDILEENIEFCKERFKEEKNIIYYRNNGYNFEELLSNCYTSVFSYDSMVHFELLDIYEYLKDIYRVLQKGGKALLHHSNYDADYKADFAHAPHARCFMNKNIFAYLAVRAGFRVLDQKIIDWYDKSNLDCISLLEK